MKRREHLLSLLGAAVAWGELPEKFLTPDGKRPSRLFAAGNMVGETVYISGTGDYSPKEEIEGKVRNCLNGVRKSLQSRGLDLENIVHVFFRIENPAFYPVFNRVYGEFFPKNPPARTVVDVPESAGDSRISITCIAYSYTGEVKPVGAPQAGSPFTPGIIAGDMLYISGMGDELPDGSHPAAFEEQVRQAMKNVGAVLNQAGLDFRHVVMSHVYLDEYSNDEIANRVYGEFFTPGDEPACATVYVDWIPGGSHVEITCWATTNLKGRKVVRPAGMKSIPGETALVASPAVWAGKTLYISSFSGFDPPAGAVPTDMEQQVRTCLMPNSGYEKNDIKVRASFIAAKTKAE